MYEGQGERSPKLIIGVESLSGKRCEGWGNDKRGKNETLKQLAVCFWLWRWDESWILTEERLIVQLSFLILGQILKCTKNHGNSANLENTSRHKQTHKTSLDLPFSTWTSKALRLASWHAVCWTFSPLFEGSPAQLGLNWEKWYKDYPYIALYNDLSFTHTLIHQCVAARPIGHNRFYTL